MKKAFMITGVIMLPVILLVACSKDEDTRNDPAPTLNCSTVPKTWSADVSVIIQASCNQTGCHAAGSNNGPGPLTNYSEVFAARVNIRDAVQSGRMPKNSTLTADKRNSIICWIDSGAPNN